MLRKGLSILILLVAVLWSPMSKATHIRAGEITIERKNCQSLTFIIYVTGYVDLIDGQVVFGGGTLDFGDGSEPIVNIRESPRVTILRDEEDLGGGNGVGITQFRVEHTYSSNGNYIVSFNEANRNGGILNMDNSIQTRFYIESVLRIDPFLGCNNSPVMLIPPIDFGCVDVAFYHNPGAYDVDGDSIAFEFVTPRKAVGTDVDNFRDVDNPEFQGAPEDGSGGPATFTIDPVTGDIVWDAPGIAGEYNIAFIVKEYRKKEGQFFLMGTVVRDMQIIIRSCDNERPSLEIPDDLCVEAGTNIQELVFATDLDGDPVKIEAFSPVFFFGNSAATFRSPNEGVPPEFQNQPAQALFEWQTTCDHIRDQPYLVTFKVTDNPPQGVSLVEFATMNIIVVAPSPKGLASVVNADRTIDLTWDDYSCTNADSMQIWRRVDSFNIAPDNCVVGMPDEAGYTLIDKVPISSTTYKDDNGGSKLAFDAKYCYRLVAQFPLPQGGESYVSAETCGLIRADGPAITHVTVDETSLTDGMITVSWRGPFEIDQALFPPPYTYELWRGNGFSGNADTKIMDVSADTTFQDTGLNTEDGIYNYVVRLFDNSNQEVRRSVSASQVRLEPAPSGDAIELSWEADVPWSINTQTYPMHYIYRDNVNSSNLAELVLIDSVNVNENGLTYEDDGSFNNTPLSELTDYCYYVVTQGSYGNPQVAAPQINLSQIVCARPSDDDPPCAPLLAISDFDCETFLADKDCDYNSFFNEISWEYDNETEECVDEIREYEIYYSSTGEEGSFERIAIVRNDIEFIHTGIPSFRGCYYVIAIDRSGNPSEPSNIVCRDNCPYYKLPNVFTPNDDGVNDLFRPLDQNSDDAVAQCPRFILSVNLKIFNRWGTQLYQYQSGGENSIYINWDGRDEQGQLLPPGMYYYSADVVFDLLPSSGRERTLTGWVQILY
jgi:gliding motility-associated-like protein